MIKINLVGEYPKVTNKIRARSFIYGFVASAIAFTALVGMHWMIHNIPPTVITGAVCAVGEDLHVEQIVRGRRLAIASYKMSLDGETWVRSIPLGCQELGAVLIQVRRGKHGPVLETMVIVQDPHNKCEGVYGP